MIAQRQYSIPEELVSELELALNNIPRTEYNSSLYADTYELASALSKAIFDKSRPLQSNDIVQLEDGLAKLLHPTEMLEHWYVAYYDKDMDAFESHAVIRDVQRKQRI